MWVKRCQKPPMTGNGKHTSYKNGDDWGMVYYCFTHINDNDDTKDSNDNNDDHKIRMICVIHGFMSQLQFQISTGKNMFIYVVSYFVVFWCIQSYMHIYIYIYTSHILTSALSFHQRNKHPRKSKTKLYKSINKQSNSMEHSSKIHKQQPFKGPLKTM